MTLPAPLRRTAMADSSAAPGEDSALPRRKTQPRSSLPPACVDGSGRRRSVIKFTSTTRFNKGLPFLAMSYGTGGGVS